MIEFKRDKDTGVLYAYKDGKIVGPMVTMGDGVNANAATKPVGQAGAEGRKTN